MRVGVGDFTTKVISNRQERKREPDHCCPYESAFAEVGGDQVGGGYFGTDADQSTEEYHEADTK